MQRLWNPCRDRPEPAAILRRCMRPQNAAEVLLILEDVVIVGRPLAARTGFRCGFEDEHDGVIASASRCQGWLARSWARTPAMSPMPQCSAHCPFFTRKISQEVKRRGRPVGATPK